jgi:hypothetical protein
VQAERSSELTARLREQDPRETGGHTPIPRYGRTPGELAESIREVEKAAA